MNTSWSTLATGVFLTFVIATGCTDGDTPTFSSLSEESSFVQKSNEKTFTKIDILWVIDNSGSMRTSQENVANNFSSFIGKFKEKGYDFQIATVTSDAWMAKYSSVPGCGYHYVGTPLASRFRDGDLSTHSGTYIITPETENIEQTFLTNSQVGLTGCGDERVFESLTTALLAPENAGFLRSDAFLSVIFVTDEDDFSKDGADYVREVGGEEDYTDPALHTPTQYLRALENLTESYGSTRRFNVNGMAIWDAECRDALNNAGTDGFVGRKIASRISELVDATGGIKGNLCGNFAASLELISDQIIQLSTQFYLERTPKPETIRVIVNGTQVPKASDNSSTDKPGGWSYDSEANSVVFLGAYVPEQGSTIDVTFDPATLEN